jgi:hypothetical protein
MIEQDEPSPLMKMTMPREMRDDPRGAGPELVLGRAVISDFSNSRVLERLLMYERRLESSLKKTMDELHKRKLIRQLEQANKEIEEGDFGTTENLQAPHGTTAKLSEDSLPPRGGQMTEDGKNAKRTQSESQNSEEKMENRPPELNLALQRLNIAGNMKEKACLE